MNKFSGARTVQTECNQSLLWIAEVQPVLARAKIRGFWANPKGLTDFLVRLLRQGG